VAALTTMALSIDRSQVARYPLCTSSKAYVLKTVALTWIVSAVTVLPLAFTRKFDPYSPTMHQCTKVNTISLLVTFKFKY